MLFASRLDAENVRFYLNRVHGFPPAYIYRTTDGRFTVVRTWDSAKPLHGLTLDD